MVEVRKLPKKEAKRSDRSSDHNVIVEGIFASFFGFNSQGINGYSNWPEPSLPPVRICLLFEEPPPPLEHGRHKWMAPNGSSHVAPKAETGQAIKIQSEGPDNVYRVGHLLADLGWVNSGFWSSRAVGPPL